MKRPVMRIKPDPITKARRTEARALNTAISTLPPADTSKDRHLRDDPGKFTAFVRGNGVFITKHLGRETKKIKIGETAIGVDGCLLYWEASKHSLNLTKLPWPITREPRKKKKSGPKALALHGPVQQFLQNGLPVLEQEVLLPPARVDSRVPSRRLPAGATLGYPTQRPGTA